MTRGDVHELRNLLTPAICIIRLREKRPLTDVDLAIIDEALAETLAYIEANAPARQESGT